MLLTLHSSYSFNYARQFTTNFLSFAVYDTIAVTFYLSRIVHLSDPEIKLISKQSHNSTEAQLTAKSQYCTRNFFGEFRCMTHLTLQES
jgi:hypothetical protein